VSHGVIVSSTNFFDEPHWRGITADTALRLARYLGSDPQFWMNLQMQYELDLAASSKLAEIERRVQPREKTA
jgi:plasmid maintenance system antidote protein VapI